MIASFDELVDRLPVPVGIDQALAEGADLVISVSGGKDSDAMATLLKELWVRRYQAAGGPVPRLIHSDLGAAEWPQTPGHVRTVAERLDLPLTVVRRAKGDLLALWHERFAARPDVPPFADSRNRLCTSSTKRDVIDLALRAWIPYGKAVMAIGLRAEESPSRARRPQFQFRSHVSTRTRHIYDWLPIHSLKIEEVWSALGTSQEFLDDLRAQVRMARRSGQDEFRVISESGWPAHVAYPLGSTRLSCSACVLASKNDLRVGARYNPAYAAALIALEQKSGYKFQANRSMADVVEELTQEEKTA